MAGMDDQAERVRPTYARTSGETEPTDAPTDEPTTDEPTDAATDIEPGAGDSLPSDGDDTSPSGG